MLKFSYTIISKNKSINLSHKKNNTFSIVRKFCSQLYSMHYVKKKFSGTTLFTCKNEYVIFVGVVGAT